MPTDAGAKQIIISGTFLSVMDMGILLTGESGVGKSELALELISRGHRLIADDAPEFRPDRMGNLRGSCPRDFCNFLEVRGLGVLNLRAMFGDGAIQDQKRLHLVVRLAKGETDDFINTDRLHPCYRVLSYLEVEVPEISLPVAPGRNLAVILETAVRNHKLRLGGYNSAKDFIESHYRTLEADGKS